MWTVTAHSVDTSNLAPDIDGYRFYKDAHCPFCGARIRLVRVAPVEHSLAKDVDSDYWYAELSYVEECRNHDCVDIDVPEEQPAEGKDRRALAPSEPPTQLALF